MENFEPAAQTQRERERRERKDPTSEQRPLIGEIAPGAIIEKVRRGQDGVEVHNVNVASGDRLEMRLVARRVRHGLAECLVRGAALPAQHGGKACHHRGDGLREIASYGDVPRTRGDRMTRRPLDQMATGEPGCDSRDARAGGELRLVGRNQGQSLGQHRRGLPHVAGDDVDQCLGPRHLVLVLESEPGLPGAIEDLPRARSAPAHELRARRLEEPCGGALPVRRQLRRAPQKERGGGRTASLPRPFRGGLQHACDSLVRSGGCGAEVPRTSVRVEFSIERRCERGMARGADRPRGPSSTRPTAPADGGRRPWERMRRARLPPRS